jgi:hypothetical protein
MLALDANFLDSTAEACYFCIGCAAVYEGIYLFYHLGLHESCTWICRS